ncbi:MAG: NAD+ kinase [Polaribacter sp.]|jgi:NAD+ kinase
MQVAVFSKKIKEVDIPYIQNFFDLFFEEGINMYVYKPYLEQLPGLIELKKDVGTFSTYLDFKARKFDFIITLGGDGTILEAITMVRDTNVPIFGINLGRLGFLANIEKNDIKVSLQQLMNGQFSLDHRRLLYLESSPSLFGECRFALNDCTLLKRDTSSMIIIHTYVNGAYLCSYWADGIIVSTPTGSTGYSLSCGGPIVFPNSGNFIITPVAPHNLNVRPIVISDESVISFEIEGRAENFLCTLDSRFEMINSEHQLAVRKCDFTIKLVRLFDQNFMNTIREKLAWGIDSRN